MELLRSLVADEGTAPLVATHDRVVEGFANALVHLADGRLTHTNTATV